LTFSSPLRFLPFQPPACPRNFVSGR
jgi:hypothetical protein